MMTMSLTHLTPPIAKHDLMHRWAELAQDEQSPDHYELTEYGELVLSPNPTNRHQCLCTQIAWQLQTQLGGMAVVEAAILTRSAGVRVPDVVWMPTEQWNAALAKQDVLEAADLVVEVLSPGNRKGEMDHKIHGYLHSGVQEVIVVGLTGTIEYVRLDARHTTSVFPLTLDLPAQLFA